ncbi:hypothetical protein OSTOST_18271, partial [Ostertagia ostertagi]
SRIARGELQNGGNGYNPTAANMYKLKWDCKLENIAYETAIKCPSNSTFHGFDDYGVNVYATWNSKFPYKGAIEGSFK